MDCRFLISRILAGQIEYQPNKKIDRIDHGQCVHCTNYPRSYQKVLNHLGRVVTILAGFMLLVSCAT